MPDKNNNPEQIPAGLVQAVLRPLWPPNTYKKKVVLGVVIVAILCFTVWVYAIPDTIKTEIIHLLKQKIAGRPEPPLKPAVMSHPQTSQSKVPKTPETLHKTSSYFAGADPFTA
jgi:hypothetical protein